MIKICTIKGKVQMKNIMRNTKLEDMDDNDLIEMHMKSILLMDYLVMELLSNIRSIYIEYFTFKRQVETYYEINLLGPGYDDDIE